jgi:2-hydroxychromene-2-carboxylate isomerase
VLNFINDDILTAFLAFRPLKLIASRHQCSLDPIPVLFAGLLNHHGQLGPAEIPSKRDWIIKDVSRYNTHIISMHRKSESDIACDLKIYRSIVSYLI